MSDPNAQPIAGWYPDPENEAGDRWWNGATWSDHRRARNAGPGWAPTAEPAAAAPAKGKKAAATTAAAAAAGPAIPVPPVAADPDRPNPYAGTVAPGATPAASYPGAQNYTGTPVAPYAPPYAYNYAPRTPMANVPAFAGMITSLCALLFNFILFGLPGIVGGAISIVGLVKANRLIAAGATVGHGRGYALIGIIAGFLGALLWDLFYFAVFSPFQFS